MWLSMAQFRLSCVKTAGQMKPAGKSFLQRFDWNCSRHLIIFVKWLTVLIFIAVFYQVVQETCFILNLDQEYFYFLEEEVSTV